MHRVSAAVWQYPDPVQPGTSGIPGKTVPAHFSWTPDLGQGRDLGERYLAGDEPKLGAARGCLASQIQGKGEVSHGPVAGLLLTDLLLVVGGLAPSHALPEGTGSHRKGLLSPEPMAAVWAGSCHVGPVAALGLGDALDALLH